MKNIYLVYGKVSGKLYGTLIHSPGRWTYCSVDGEVVDRAYHMTRSPGLLRLVRT